MGGTLDWLAMAGYVMMAIGSNLFVILYSVLARFWKTESGLHIFLFMLTVSLILDHSAIILVFGRYPGSAWVRAFLYPALGAIILWRVLILIRVQLLARRRDPEDVDAE